MATSDANRSPGLLFEPAAAATNPSVARAGDPFCPDKSMPLTYSVGISSNGHRFVIDSESDAGSGTSVSRCTTRRSMPAWA